MVVLIRRVGPRMLGPRGRDRHCRTQWVDNCSPGPTDRRPGRSLRPGLGRAFEMWKQGVEGKGGFVCKMLDVFFRIAVVDGEGRCILSKATKCARCSVPIELTPASPVFDISCVKLECNTLQTGLDSHIGEERTLGGVTGETRRTRSRLHVLGPKRLRTRSTCRAARTT